jgi:hypothetical protein
MQDYIQKGVDNMRSLFSVSLLVCKGTRIPINGVDSKEVERPSLKASSTGCKKLRIVGIFRDALS